MPKMNRLTSSTFIDGVIIISFLDIFFSRSTSYLRKYVNIMPVTKHVGNYTTKAIQKELQNSSKVNFS